MALLVPFFITSLVWRGPWLGIEPGTSRTRSQHYTTRLSRRRYWCIDYWCEVIVFFSNKASLIDLFIFFLSDNTHISYINVSTATDISCKNSTILLIQFILYMYIYKWGYRLFLLESIGFYMLVKWAISCY